jgi:hypothetical protein
MKCAASFKTFNLVPAHERNKIGARLCAKHQPQHVEKLCDIRHIPADWFAKLLRLVFDTAALREQCQLHAKVPPSSFID